MRKIIIILLFASVSATFAFALEQVNIQFSRPQNAPYFVGQPEMNIDADEYSTVILKIRSDKSGTARLFWTTNFDNRMDEPKSVWFFIDRSDYTKEYVFNLSSQGPYWAGFVGQLLVLPENGPDSFTVESALAVHSGLTNNLRSGWQEFWGPRGRLVIGSTINTIQSSNLFGRPIFVSLYWLIGLLTAGYGAYQLYLLSREKKKRPLALLWLTTGRFAVIAIAAGWLLLEASSLFTDYVQIKTDWKYVGQSSEGKLVLANTGDFYPFLEFCEQNIPSHAILEMRMPPPYYYSQARYYLYPRQTSTTEAAYLVVYDQAVEPSVAAHYSVLKTFRDKAYILKKR